ncbi:MAG: ribonuclease E/G [Candidatus Njordarchaeia archaeon]
MGGILSISSRNIEKPFVRIRGIYSTALTKMLLDNNYIIVQPSEEITKRFNLEPKIVSPHIDIWDKENKQGIHIETFPQFTDKLVNLFQTNFEDSVIRYEKFQVGAIYKGVIYRPAPWGGMIVKLTPNLEGHLPENEIEHQRFSIGDTVVVEVKNPKGNHGYPLLSTKVSVPGDLAVLIPEETVRISHKIRGPTRSRLLEIGQILRPDGWGIIWRTSAHHADPEELKEEVDFLIHEAEKLGEAMEKAPALTKIRNGLDNLEIEFPFESKEKLDKIRGDVLPTIKGHHWYKSFSNSLTEIIDFSEKILSQKLDIETLSEAISQYVMAEKFPREGDLIKIQHVKINGREIILGPARLILSKKNGKNTELMMYRRFKPGGFYDGIEAPKEVGDYGITIARSGDDKLITAYFDVNNKLKGIYLNLNTPIEVYGTKIRYIDLEIDVVVNVNGGMKILDTQKLEEYYNNRSITEKIFNQTKEKAEMYREWLRNGGINEIMDKCEEVRNKLSEEEEEDEETDEFNDIF